MNIRTVIFDLDGTLIDSAPSILASMQAAFDQIGIEPIRPLTHDLVGPPLVRILTSMLDEKQLSRLPDLMEGFKRHYDEVGCRATLAYRGIEAMLTGLQDRGFSLYIATNKRIIPSRNIVEHLGWRELFKEVYALDYFTPSLPSKSAMLSRVCAEIDNQLTIYVGDRAEDAQAAQECGLPFMGVAWGYGGDLSGVPALAKPSEPTQLFEALVK